MLTFALCKDSIPPNRPLTALRLMLEQGFEAEYDVVVFPRRSNEPLVLRSKPSSVSDGKEMYSPR